MGKRFGRNRNDVVLTNETPTFGTVSFMGSCTSGLESDDMHVDAALSHMQLNITAVMLKRIMYAQGLFLSQSDAKMKVKMLKNGKKKLLPGQGVYVRNLTGLPISVRAEKTSKEEVRRNE